MAASEKYECENPPCIHVVVDNDKKVFAVFVEDWEGNILLIRSEEIVKAFNAISDALAKGFREADPQQADYLARKYLDAEPVEE